MPYAYAATAPESRLIVTAGACPLDDQGRVVAPGDVATQARRALQNLRIALEECLSLVLLDGRSRHFVGGRVCRLIRQPHVDRVLRELARHPALTHEVLEQLPAGRTTDYMRNLLVEQGVLPSRDERLARFQSWAVTAQQRITIEERRKLVARFIRWSLEKRLRR